MFILESQMQLIDECNHYGKMTYAFEAILLLWHRANIIIHLVSVANYSDEIRV